MKKFNTVYVDSLDIYKGKDEITEDLIAKQVRAIAERNKLKEGDSINADIFYKKNGEEIESLTTVTYSEQTLIVQHGYRAKKFDQVYTDDELEQN